MFRHSCRFVLGGPFHHLFGLSRFRRELHVIYFDAPTTRPSRTTGGTSIVRPYVAGVGNMLSPTEVGIRSLRHSADQVEDGDHLSGDRVIPMASSSAWGRRELPNSCRKAPASMSPSTSMRSTGSVSAEPNGMTSPAVPEAAFRRLACH